MLNTFLANISQILNRLIFLKGIVVNPDVSSGAAGYHVQGGAQRTKTGLHLPLKLNNGKKNIFGKTIDSLSVDVSFDSAERLHVKIADTAGKQYLVPNSPLGFERPKISHAASHLNYDFHYTEKPFSFKVVRKSDKEVLFDTTGQPLVFEDQYLELTTKVPDNANIYGFGELTGAYRRNNNANVTTMWARDVADPFYQNQYGTHPTYTEIRNGKAHGAFLLNAHGMDVFTVTGRITYKVIGGILDFYFFVPEPATPNSVVRAYTDLVGKSIMPAQWMLGWHQCRYGYHDIEEVDTVVEEYRKNKIPLETMWTDIGMWLYVIYSSVGDLFIHFMCQITWIVLRISPLTPSTSPFPRSRILLASFTAVISTMLS
jgi:alpha-glucosidase